MTNSSSPISTPSRRNFLSAAGGATVALSMSAARAQAAPKSTLEQVREAGVLKAGVTTVAPFFGFIDERGNHTGFEYDLTVEIAKRLNVKLEVTRATTTSRVPLLQQGRVDMVIGTLTHYRSRDDVIDFTIDYFNTPQTMMVRKDSVVRKVADMKGRRLGTALGSNTSKYFKEAEPGVTIQTFESEGEAFIALEQKLVDAMATDLTQLAGFRANAKKPEDFLLLGKEGTYGGGPFGIGVRENDSKWRDALNYKLQDIWVDGTWDKLYNKWVGPGTKMNLPKELLDFKMELWH